MTMFSANSVLPIYLPLTLLYAPLTGHAFSGVCILELEK